MYIGEYIVVVGYDKVEFYGMNKQVKYFIE